MTTSASGGTCRVELDLRGVAWAGDQDVAEGFLCNRPGVLSAQVDPVARRAVVVHDAGTSLPQLWNWLSSCREHPFAP